MSIRKRKNKSAKNGYVYEVYFKYMYNGKTKRFSKSGFLTKKQALEFEALKKLELGSNGQIKKKCRKTLNQVFEEFLTSDSNRYQYNTVYGTKSNYNRNVRNELGNILISDINYKTLQDFFNNRSNIGLETNKSTKKALNRILEYAIKAEYIETNPIKYVNIIGQVSTKEKNNLLSPEEIETILRELKNNQTYLKNAYYIAVQIGRYTGLRISEVLALDKSDIDLKYNVITPNKKLVYDGLKKDEIYASKQMKSKASKSTIPLPEVLKPELIEWYKINQHEHVVCDFHGNYINPKVMSTYLKKIAKKHGIDFHFHMLRHTFGTTLYLNNVDLKTTQELMRHSSSNTTMNFYTHINDQHKQDVINKVFAKKVSTGCRN